MMKRGLQVRQKKTLSAAGLLKIIREDFEKIVAPERKDRRGRKQEISIADSLMSAVAMFGLKSPSLLSFDRTSKDKVVAHNLKTLYGINRVPSDTYMREILDEINPDLLRKPFVSIFSAIQKNKLLKPFDFLGTYLVGGDGTGIFNSDKINCESCCKKTHADGTMTFYHMLFGAAIMHPDSRQVIPLCPELMSKQDGSAKNDCERRAAERFLSAFKKEHPHLKITFLLDALSANTPQINEIKKYGFDFIINVKPGSNKALFEWINGLDLDKKTVTAGKNKYKFRYINNIPLNDAKDAPNVNFLECIATEVEGTRITEKRFTWVTSHFITKKNVYSLMRGGRCRWKVENETFNTLKNQGYQFEHSFGHGKKNLMSVFAITMMLAFLIDQIQEAVCGLFQASLKKVQSRRALWEKMRCYFFVCFINSWEDLFNAISNEIGVSMPQNLASDSS
jgi:hypothetical protein